VLGNDTDPDGDTHRHRRHRRSQPRHRRRQSRRHPHLHPGRQLNGPVDHLHDLRRQGRHRTAIATVTVNRPRPGPTGTGAGTVRKTPGQTTASGTLTITDPDAGEAAFQPQTNVAGTYGSFSIDAAGAWTYTLDNSQPAVQALKEGETRTETFTVKSADGTPTTVTITVLGTNDGPSPARHRHHQRRPAGHLRRPRQRHRPGRRPVTVTGATVDPAKGTVVVNPDGTLTFNPAANVNGPVTVTYTISDGTAAPPPAPPPSTSRPSPTTPYWHRQRHRQGRHPTRAPPPAPSPSSTRTPARPSSSPRPTSPAPTAASASTRRRLDLHHRQHQARRPGPEGRRDPHRVLHRLSADGTATTVSLTVVGTNDGPVANPSTATTPEETPVTLNVLGNDSDPDGDTLTVTGATVDPAKGSVTINPDGTLAFNPAPNFNGPVEITYTISDGKGGSATSTVTVNVTPANDAPLAVNDSATTTEDSPVSRTPATGVLTNDSDIDSPSLTVSGVRTGTSGAFTAPAPPA
jgi:VCBS repeat-containing protein